MKNKSIYLIIGIIGIIIAITLAIISPENGYIPIIIVVIVLIAFIVGYLYKRYLSFKNDVVKKSLEAHKETIKYEYKLNEKKQYIELIRKYKLITSATSFSFTDCIYEKDENFEYKSFDLKATHTQSTGKTTTTITDFYGKFYDVKIKPDYCNYVLKEEYWTVNIKGYEFLELEVIDFNNKLNLYVTDKFEAQKVFTPSVINQYLSLITSDSYKTYIASIDDHLYIFLYNNESQFENMSSSSEEIIKEYNNQLDILNKYLKALNKDFQ